MSLFDSFQPERPVYAAMGGIMQEITNRYNTDGVQAVEAYIDDTNLAQFEPQVALIRQRGISADTVLTHFSNASMDIELLQTSPDRVQTMDLAQKILGYAGLLARFRQEASMATMHQLLTMRETVVVGALAIQRVHASKVNTAEALVVGQQEVRDASEVAIAAVARVVTGQS